MTKEERRLWYDFLKQLPVTVNRQKVIDHYIVDFYMPRLSLRSSWTAHSTMRTRVLLPIGKEAMP